MAPDLVLDERVIRFTRPLLGSFFVPGDDDVQGRIVSFDLFEASFQRFTAEEIHQHFREEYSTYGFLLESMLERVGFEILESEYEDDFYASYICQWQGAPK